MGELRQKLYSGWLDQGKKEQLMMECNYFASIAPKSLFDKINLKEKFNAMTPGGRTALLVVGIILALPLLLIIMPLIVPVVIILLLISMVTRKMNQSPEYANYDYWNRIVNPTFKLFDDKLEAGFRTNPYDLVDTEMPYNKALEEGRMIKPLPNRYLTTMYSSASYNWEDYYDTEAFEFMGYRLYTEHTDDDGHTTTVTYFNGGIFKFHTSFSVNGTVNIMSTYTKKNLFGIEKEKNQFKKIQDKEVSVIDTENHEFAENFDTIATYDEEAYKYLTPAMIENLLYLRKQCFFALCIKGNVMTVTINDGFKGATPSAFGPTTKPYYAPRDPVGDLNQRIANYGNAMISIYELKDILDPAGRRQ